MAAPILNIGEPPGATNRPEPPKFGAMPVGLRGGAPTLEVPKAADTDPEKATAMRLGWPNAKAAQVVRRALNRGLEGWHARWQAFDITEVPPTSLDTIKKDQGELSSKVEELSSKKVGARK